ncbi:MAG: phage holin family protein [Chitinophagaceae bacterium]|nr:phage holin family protein [Rubrivivax sp.]
MLRGLVGELPQLFNDRVDLLSLELQRAGRAVTQIVLLVVAAAILGVTAWLVFWVGVVALLMAAGLAWPWALLAVLLVNLLAAYAAVRHVRLLLPQVALPATRRHLRFSPSPQPPAPAPGARPNENRDERSDLAAASQPANG